MGGTKDRAVAKNEFNAECGIPVFGIEGLTSKGESLLYFSLDDLKAEWKRSGKGPMPEVEVFDFVEVMKAMEGEDGGAVFDKIRFVSCKEGKEWKEDATSKGSGTTRLRPMKKNDRRSY